MHEIQCDVVKFQNCTSLVKYKYIPIHTGIYRYVQVHTSKTQQTSFDHTPSSLLRLPVSDSQTTQARLSKAKIPQPSVDLVHVAARTREIYKYIAVYTSTYKYIPVDTNI